MNTDYYAVLDVDSTATAGEIKRAFRKLARDTHPDSHPGAGGHAKRKYEEAFKQIEEAYRVLKDPIRRAHFDQTGSGQLPKSKEQATTTVIHAFQKHIKRVLEEEILIERAGATGTWAAEQFNTNKMDKILDAIKSEFNTNIKEIEGSIKTLTLGVTKLNKYKRCIKSKGETNLYAQVIEQQLEATQGALASAGTSLIVAQTALTYLDDYEFTAEDIIEAPNLIAGIRTDCA